ncbi:Uncharacterised protein [uncultured archaeon]|nr:Uncharacterised protein [uncultured archaeon]
MGCSLDSLSKMLSFSSINSALCNKTYPLSKDLELRIKDATSFFGDFISSLQSLETGKYVFFNNDISSLLEYMGYLDWEVRNSSMEKQRGVINKAVSDTRGYIEGLNFLKENPSEFYSDKEKTEKLSHICGIMCRLFNYFPSPSDLFEPVNDDD